MRPFATFIAELRRRRVFRVAAVYGGVAFVLFQIIDSIFEPLHIPEWIGSLIIILLLVGFPLAVGLAWVFDITPEGIVRTGKARGDDVTPSPSKPGGSSGKPLTSNRALIAVAVAVMYFENLTGDAAFDWLEAGMVQMLTANLGHMEGMEVISSQRLSDILRQVMGAWRLA